MSECWRQKPQPGTINQQGGPHAATPHEALDFQLVLIERTTHNEVTPPKVDFPPDTLRIIISLGIAKEEHITLLLLSISLRANTHKTKRKNSN